MPSIGLIEIGQSHDHSYWRQAASPSRSGPDFGRADFWLCPPLAPYPRFALGAHIQFVTNGMLFVVLAIVVLKVPHRAGSMSLRVMVVSAWLTWFMAMSEAANAWWGANQMLPIAARQAGASGAAAWQEAVVKLCHLPAALGLILSVTLLIIGIVNHGGATEPADAA